MGVEGFGCHVPNCPGCKAAALESAKVAALIAKYAKPEKNGDE